MMNKNINFETIRNHILKWQFENDNDFSILPNDNHSSLIFNHKNEIVKFIFSNKQKRDMCKLSLSKEIYDIYDCFIEQEDGFTFYKIT